MTPKSKPIKIDRQGFQSVRPVSEFEYTKPATEYSVSINGKEHSTYIFNAEMAKKCIQTAITARDTTKEDNPYLKSWKEILLDPSNWPREIMTTAELHDEVLEDKGFYDKNSNRCRIFRMVKRGLIEKVESSEHSHKYKLNERR